MWPSSLATDLHSGRGDPPQAGAHQNVAQELIAPPDSVADRSWVAMRTRARAADQRGDGHGHHGRRPRTTPLPTTTRAQTVSTGAASRAPHHPAQDQRAGPEVTRSRCLLRHADTGPQGPPTPPAPSSEANQPAGDHRPHSASNTCSRFSPAVSSDASVRRREPHDRPAAARSICGPAGQPHSVAAGQVQISGCPQNPSTVPSSGGTVAQPDSETDS